jgi:uncharacterized protein (TIGR02266 family)
MAQRSSVPPADGANRRIAPRFEARVRVRFKSIEELVTAYSQDISRGGLYIAAGRQLPRGSWVELWLELPDGGPPARIAARVAYALDQGQAAQMGRDAGMGMEFVDPDTVGLADRIATFLGATLGGDHPAVPATVLHVIVASSVSDRRRALTTAFEESGHRVTRAHQGLDALGKVLNEAPDVIVSDVDLANLDGWQLLRLVRNREAIRHVPVVFLGELVTPEDSRRAAELDLDEIIPASLPASEIAEKVARIAVRGRRRSASPDGLNGTLDQLPVASLLAFCESERRSGVLVITSKSSQAVVELSQGFVTGVLLPDDDAPKSAMERLIRVLDWTDGRFVLKPGEPASRASPEYVSVQGALLEHARRSDEGGR